LANKIRDVMILITIVTITPKNRLLLENEIFDAMLNIQIDTNFNQLNLLVYT